MRLLVVPSRQSGRLKSAQLKRKGKSPRRHADDAPESRMGLSRNHQQSARGPPRAAGRYCARRMLMALLYINIKPLTSMAGGMSIAAKYQRRGSRCSACWRNTVIGRCHRRWAPPADKPCRVIPASTARVNRPPTPPPYWRCISQIGFLGGE